MKHKARNMEHPHFPKNPIKSQTWFWMVLFSLLLITLLIGQRFGARWAGADGYQPTRLAQVSAHDGADTQAPLTYSRGETIRTQADERLALLLVPNVHLAMDERTDVTIERLEEHKVTLTLTRGRIVIINNDPIVAIEVRTNHTQNRFAHGWVSFVNFDFKEEVDIYPEDMEVETLLKLTDLKMTSSRAVSIHETRPVEYRASRFDPSAGAAAEFYAWTRAMLDGLRLPR